MKDVWGDNKLVIINPGQNHPGMYNYYSRRIDIISVERHVETPVWQSQIPAIHWLAVEDGLGNDLAAQTQAQAHLSQFRGNGGFWYYGTQQYSVLSDNSWLVPLTNAAHPGRPDCGCVTPNPQNRLQNPAFNGSLSGWVLDSGSGVFSHVPGSFQDEFGNFADATDCQSSGSARLDTPWDGSADSQRIWQCVSVSPNTTYNFGAKILGRGSYAYCDLDLYASGDCSGAPSNAASGLWLNVVWSPDQDAVVTTDGNTMSARVSCHIEGGGSAFFDMAYLTPWPGDF